MVPQSFEPLLTTCPRKIEFEQILPCAEIESEPRNIRSVYAQCCVKTHIKARGPMNRAVAGFKAWYKADGIESEIEALRDEVQRCYIRFTVSSHISPQILFVKLLCSGICYGTFG